VKGRSREAQVPALCEMFDQPYVFSDPLTMAATLDKAVAKRIVRDAGVPTAPFLVFDRPDCDLTDWTHYPAFVKPIAEGTGKGCEKASLVANESELRAMGRRILADYGQPALVESFLPGREFTVGILGSGEKARVIGVMEIALESGADENVYSLRNKEECETLVRYTRAGDAEAMAAAEVALDAYRILECRDAARVDLRSDAHGRPMFLEVNPIAGLHPSHSDLPILAGLHGMTYDTLLSEIVAEAASRHATVPGRRDAATGSRASAS
jgi:D-alanine-D-alanine ligase